MGAMCSDLPNGLHVNFHDGHNSRPASLFPEAAHALEGCAATWSIAAGAPTLTHQRLPSIKCRVPLPCLYSTPKTVSYALLKQKLFLSTHLYRQLSQMSEALIPKSMYTLYLL